MNVESAASDRGAGSQKPSPLHKFVLITPARNEAAFIELTIKSVVAQTARPLKWVIVSDGSTDGTDEVVKRYTDQYEWIELLRMTERKERHFAGKVNAFNAGYARLGGLGYDVIGSLDADISFEPDYFQFLLSKFQLFPDLGVVGTPFTEEGTAYDYRFTSTEHVSGACQLFRRACFEMVGGYVPLAVGGIDLVAVTTARMMGWQTKTFTEKMCVHHKKTQSGKHSTLKRIFKSGYHDYLMGGHPIWQVFRSLYQMGKTPLFLGGCALLMGYGWAATKRARRPVSPEFVKFRRKEQLCRLGCFLGRSIGSRHVAPRKALEPAAQQHGGAK